LSTGDKTSTLNVTACAGPHYDGRAMAGHCKHAAWDHSVTLHTG